MLPPDILTQAETLVGDLSLDPADLLDLAADFQDAQAEAQTQSGTIMSFEPLLGNGDGLLSSQEVENALALVGSLPIPIPLPIPADIDPATAGQLVDVLDFNGDGGLDQQELELLLTMGNMLGSLQAL